MGSKTFLDIPPEIRIAIYHQFFPGSKLTFFHLPDTSSTAPNSLRSNHSHILLTSQQIRLEALPIYFAHLHVIYDIDLIRRSINWTTGQPRLAKYRVQPLAFGQLLQRRIDVFLTSPMLRNVQRLTIKGEKLRMRDWGSVTRELPELRELTIKETDARIDLYRGLVMVGEGQAGMEMRGDESYYEAHLRTLPDGIFCRFVSGREPGEGYEEMEKWVWKYRMYDSVTKTSYFAEDPDRQMRSIFIADEDLPRGLDEVERMRMDMAKYDNVDGGALPELQYTSSDAV